MLLSNDVFCRLIKDYRKQQKLTITDLSQRTGYSTGSISLFENSNNILTDNKTASILNALNLPEDYLSIIPTTIEPLITEWIDACKRFDDELFSSIYAQLSKLLITYTNTTLSFLYDYVCFINAVYFIDNSNNYEQQIKNIKDHLQYLMPKYASIFYVHLGIHFFNHRDYVNAKKAYVEVPQYIVKDHYYEDIYEYSLARYYVRVNDLFLSMEHFKIASELLSVNHLHRRIFNLKFTTMLQFMKMKSYQNAIDTGVDIIESSIQLGYEDEATMATYNVAYIYMIKRDYEKALMYLKKIPTTQMRPKYLISELIIYTLTNQTSEAFKTIAYAKQLDTTHEYQSLIQIFSTYLNSYDEKNFVNELENFYNEELGSETFDREFYLLILIEKYKQLHSYKKATYYLEKLYDLVV